MVQLLGWDAKKIFVVGNGIDDRFYAAAAAPTSANLGCRTLSGHGWRTDHAQRREWTIAVAEELLRRNPI